MRDLTASPASSSPSSSSVLTAREVARELKVSRNAANVIIKRIGFNLGQRRGRVRRVRLEQWLAEQERRATSTSGPGGKAS